METRSNIYYNNESTYSDKNKVIGDYKFQHSAINKGCCEFLRKTDVSEFITEIPKTWLPQTKILNRLGFESRDEYVMSWLNFIKSLGTFDVTIAEDNDEHICLYVKNSHNLKRLAHHTIFRYLFDPTQYTIPVIVNTLNTYTKNITDPIHKLWFAEQIWARKTSGSSYGYLINSNTIPLSLHKHIEKYKNESELAYVTNICSNEKSLPDNLCGILNDLFKSIYSDIKDIFEDNSTLSMKHIAKRIEVINDEVIGEYSLVGKNIKINVDILKGFSTKNKYKIQDIHINKRAFKSYTLMNDDFENVKISKRFCELIV